MSRKSCLAVILVQLILLCVLVGMNLLGGAGKIQRDIAEPLFKVIGFLFVAMSPFGILSLFLSLGFSFMDRHKFFTPGMRRFLASGTPVMFFVWDEFRQSQVEAIR